MDNIKRGLGYIFTLVLFTTVLTLLPELMTTASNSNFDFLKFFSAAMLAFVGAAPAFKGIDKKYHSKFAMISALSGLLWIILATPYWYVIFIVTALMMASMMLTKTKKCITYWLEMIMFVAIYSVVALYIY